MKFFKVLIFACIGLTISNSNQLLAYSGKVLYNNVTIERLNRSDHIYKVDKVVLVNSSKGLVHSDINILVDSFTKLTSLRIKVYNKHGKLVEKVNKNNLLELPYHPDYVFYSDLKLLYYQVRSRDFPIKVEISYQVNCYGTLGFDPWLPSGDKFALVDSASLTVKCNKPNDIHYKFNDSLIEFKKLEENDELIYSWKYTPRQEGDTVSIKHLVQISPRLMSYNEIEGDFSTWKDYGVWVNSLLEKVSDSNEAINGIVFNLTNGLQTDIEKIEILYKHIQQNYRYVAISEGISGFQPMPASEVFDLKYGDCKGLTNLLRVMLLEAGIESHYTEIDSDISSNDFDKDFCTVYSTNHAILCVPNHNDTIWLECTSPFRSAGSIGLANSDRYACLITKEGGALAKTPSIFHYPDFISKRSRITYGESNCKEEITLFMSGFSFEVGFPIFVDNESIDRMDLLDEFNSEILTKCNHTISNIELDKYEGSISTVCNSPTLLKEEAGLFFCRRSFPLRYLDYRLKNKLPNFSGDSISNFILSDTLIIVLPEHLGLFSKPDDNQFMHDLGRVTIETKIWDNQVFCIRRVELNTKKHDKSSLSLKKEFLAICSRLSNIELILNKI